jgi:hypothetical protein
MADGSFPQLISKDRDVNSSTNAIFSTLVDAAGDQIAIDGSGNLAVSIASITTNYEYAEDSAAGSGDVGVSILAVRRDTPGTGIGVDGDYTTLSTDATGNLRTTASLTIGKVDDSAFTIGSDEVIVNGFLADETTPDSVDEGDVGAARMTLDRRQLFVLTDATTQSQRLAINASGEASILSNYEYAVDAAAGGSDVAVPALGVRDDTLTTLTPVDGDYVNLRLTSTGALWVEDVNGASGDPTHTDDSAFTVGADIVSANGFLADETAPDSVDEGDVGIPRMTLDRKVLTRVVGATDANRLDIDGSGHAQVDLAAVSVTAVPVSADSSANSELNPIYVKTTNTAVSGSEVHDYDTAAAVASDATDNHDYTVANTTFLLKSVIVSGSGNIKFEIQTGPVASLATDAVGFLTGRQGDTKQLFFDPAIEVPATSTGTVRVIRTNRQGAATDLYSTIIGNDV